MTLKRLVICAALALAAAFPASASALQPSITPPDHDNYLDSLILTPGTTKLKYENSRIFSADTTSYTDQEDMFNPPSSGGPREPNVCVYPTYKTVFGKTVWAAFRAGHWGTVSFNATGGPFDKVVGVVPFKSLDDAKPRMKDYGCYDDKVGVSETARGLVSPKQWYAVQIGGTNDNGTAAAGGFVQVSYTLHRPKQVGGRAFLFWHTKPMRVTKSYVTGVPAGATLKLTCSKHSCKKRTIHVHGAVQRGKALAQPSSARRSAAKVRMKNAVGPAGDPSPGAAFKPIVHASGKRINLLKNKRVKPGSKIELRISAYGMIGRYYRWNVKKNSITPATTRCMDVGKSRPKKKCSG
jgi:hypothetical protein